MGDQNDAINPADVQDGITQTVSHGLSKVALAAAAVFQHQAQGPEENPVKHGDEYQDARPQYAAKQPDDERPQKGEQQPQPDADEYALGAFAHDRHFGSATEISR